MDHGHLSPQEGRRFRRGLTSRKAPLAVPREKSFSPVEDLHILTFANPGFES